MNTPEVKFELPSIDDETTMIFHFCYEKSRGGLDWSEAVYKHHPKLKEMLLGVKDKEEFYKICHDYTDNFIRENKEILEKTRDHYQKVWEETEDLFFNNLSKDFETDFPEEINKIIAKVSINPICPRNIDSWSFHVYYKFHSIRVKTTCIHEIIHFLYFKKWSEIFSDYDDKKFNGPNSEWKLSEILVHSIINNNKMIQGIINNEYSDVYKEWQSIKINDRKLVDYFGDIYREHEDGKISFEDFLKKSWSEYQKHRNIIEKDILG